MEVSCKVERSNTYFAAMVIWIVAALGVPYQFVLQSTPNVMIPMLMQTMHISEKSIGFLTSSFFYTYLLFQVPAGLLIDRFGVRRVLSGSIFFAAFACLLFASAHYFVIANVSRLLMGLATAPCVPAIMYIAAKRFSPKRFVILAGLAESIGMLGGAVGEALLGDVVMQYGWRQTMYGCGLIGFGVALLIYAIVRDRACDAITQTAECSSFRQILRGFLHVMQSTQVWYIVIYGGLVFALLPALAGLWIVQALQDMYTLGIQVAALGSSMLFLGTAIGLPFWGWCSEKMQKRRPVMFIATICCFLLVAVFVYVPHMPLGLVFLLLLFIGFTCAVYVLAFALVREQTTAQVRASAMGLTNMMAMIIGAPLLQPLIGAVLDNFKARASENLTAQLGIMYHYAFSSILVCLLLAFVFLFFIRETYCQEQYK